MQAVILVGGEGTRLRPLTYSRPKALVPFLGRPLIHWIIECVRSHGFRDIIFAVSHGKESLAAALRDGAHLGVHIQYADEPSPLGSGGAIRNAASMLKGSTFLVLNGDVIADIDLQAMLDLHRRTGAIASIALTLVEDTSGFGVVEIDEDHRIATFVEKPPPEEAPSRWANAGFWIFEPAALQWIPDGHSMVETQLFPTLIAAGERVTGYRSPAYWMDIGTPQRYLSAHRDRMQGRSSVAATAVVDKGAQISGPTIIGSRALVRQGAHLVGTTYLGEDCKIATDAWIESSVLWERVQVGQGARVQDSILAEDVVIGAGARVEEAVLGAGTAVAPGERTPPGLRLDPGQRYPA